jgi:hypothetical protein
VQRVRCNSPVVPKWNPPGSTSLGILPSFLSIGVLLVRPLSIRRCLGRRSHTFLPFSCSGTGHHRSVGVVSIDSHEILDVFSSSPILLVIPACNWTTKVSPLLLCMVRHTSVPVCLPSLWALICFLLIGRPCRLSLFLVHYAVSYRHIFFEILTPLSAHCELSPYSL